VCCFQQEDWTVELWIKPTKVEKKIWEMLDSEVSRSALDALRAASLDVLIRLQSKTASLSPSGPAMAFSMTALGLMTLPPSRRSLTGSTPFC